MWSTTCWFCEGQKNCHKFESVTQHPQGLTAQLPPSSPNHRIYHRQINGQVVRRLFLMPGYTPHTLRDFSGQPVIPPLTDVKEAPPMRKECPNVPLVQNTNDFNNLLSTTLLSICICISPKARSHPWTSRGYSLVFCLTFAFCFKWSWF
jgi:hypothetical protein